ncbi:uncharacterized protein LOC112556587 [Pomacea canaliculata]|nr:uncharacterized protein LOC112556587 [Pomacea canaliculata]XP_025081524.1 uncharacterized protein LOC112556587 [Pomacea canaliculata]XP_025081525.1 uncharacterized protein LOC112556587 [Pomacea canaliculata]
MWPTNIRFPVCVHQRVEPVRSRACTQAPSPGGCGGQLRRWFYNVHMGACAWFTYGGCGANSNNFLTREDCENTCIKAYSTTDTTTSTFLVKDVDESGVVGKPFPDGRKYVGRESGVSWRDPEPPNSGRHGDERDRGHLSADIEDAGLSSHNQQTRFSGTKPQTDLVQHVPSRLNTLEMRYGRPDEVRTSVNGRYIQNKDHMKGRSYEPAFTPVAIRLPQPPSLLVSQRSSSGTE